MKRDRALALALLAGLTILLGGCGLRGGADNKSKPATSLPQAANPGERQGTIPASAQEDRQPEAPATSPEQALDLFAALYVNWSYRTLSDHEARLAAMAVGDARETERQGAAAAQRNSSLQQGQIYNRGRVIAIGPVAGQVGRYAVVTREETGGNQEYAGLQAEFHVTLATVQKTSAGWAVSEWQPQS